jgi:hypothetical protein
MSIKVIVTGTTGMVGEGVMLECLANPVVKEVLSVVRKSSGHKHPKLKELRVPDFLNLEDVKNQLSGYDACFFCAGISSVGMSEVDYTRITYDITLYFARSLVDLNPQMVFTYVSGAMTDSSEKGRVMWARVKGKTENALMRLPFRSIYNFRPGLMKATVGQQKVKPLYKLMNSLYPIVSLFYPNGTCTLKEVGTAMINCVLKGYEKQVLEVRDIKVLGR